MGDHTEVVQVDFDPAETRFEDLLNFFDRIHNPSRQKPKRQYWNAVFYHHDDQEELVRSHYQQHPDLDPQSIETSILPVRSFTQAEDYHQKYYIQQQGSLFQQLLEHFPDFQAFVDDPLVAQINAFLAGALSQQKLFTGDDPSPYISEELLRNRKILIDHVQQ